MKHPILASVVAFGVVCVASASVAQDTETTNLRNVTVTGTWAPYETYVVDVDRAYGLHVLVGHNHRQYMEAQRVVASLEALRMKGLAPGPYVSVAIDNSSGPGVGRQIQLMDEGRNTVALVNAYCKASVPSGGDRCKFAPRSASTDAYRQRVALTLPATTAAGEDG